MSNVTENSIGWKWTEDATFALINLMKMNYDNTQTGVNELAYVEICEELSTIEDVNISFEQVESKWKVLQRIYKKIKDKYNSTGNARRHWPFYDAMDEIFNNVSEINPLAVVSSDKSTEKSTVCKWTESMTFSLITLVKIKYDKIQTGVKKLAYIEISEELSTMESVDISYGQVESKWKGLKRAYKKLKNEINKTGNARRQWPFYDAMDEILHNAPTVLSSDDNNFIINVDGKDIYEDNMQEQRFSTKRKRKYSQLDAREAAIAKRHTERMAVSNRFLDLFEKMIEKM